MVTSLTILNYMVKTLFLNKIASTGSRDLDETTVIYPLIPPPRKNMCFMNAVENPERQRSTKTQLTHCLSDFQEASNWQTMAVVKSSCLVLWGP